jgi:hypothetical protein
LERAGREKGSQLGQNATNLKAGVIMEENYKRFDELRSLENTLEEIGELIIAQKIHEALLLLGICIGRVMEKIDDLIFE